MRTTTRLNAMTGMLDVTVYDGNECSFELGHRGKPWGWIPRPDDDACSSFPTFTVPVDMAESIMAALLLHFGINATPVNPPHDYHAEYMAERERVDKLLDAIVALTEN